MLPLDIHNLRAAVLAAAIAIAAIVLFEVAAAHAQLIPGGGCGDTALDPCFVTDPPVENSTGDLDTVQLPPIVTSVTTGGGGGWWHPQANYLASLTSNLDQGVDTPAAFVADFPGWQSLPPRAVDVAKQLSRLALNTYAGALADAQQQAGNFTNEDAALSQLEASSSQSTALLQAIQANTEALLAIVQQQQLTRQLLIALIDMQAVKAGEEINERGQAGATTSQSQSFGIAP